MRQIGGVHRSFIPLLWRKGGSLYCCFLGLGQGNEWPKIVRSCCVSHALGLLLGSLETKT